MSRSIIVYVYVYIVNIYVYSWGRWLDEGLVESLTSV